MTISCPGCGGPADRGTVCTGCRRDPFMMEEARKQAAKLGSAAVLEQLYKEDCAFLKQGQVKLLWNDLLHHNKDQTPEFTIWRNRMTIELVPHGVKRILEIGVGRGYAIDFLSKRFPDLEIYGTDISEEAVQHASARFKGHFAVAELGELPWKGLKFDAVLILEVLEHVEAPRTFAVLRWLHSMLADTGYLVLSVPLETVSGLREANFICPHCGQFVNQNGHVRSYSELQPIQMELALSGFRVDRTLGLAGGRYFGIRRQRLMAIFPKRVKPMVMTFRCQKQR